MQQVSTFATDHGGLALAPYLQIKVGPGDWPTFHNTLAQPNTRNLHYYGHGSSTTLGYGSNDRNNGVRASAIRSVLRNNFIKEEIRIRHPFRFVFLDGCETGSAASEWPASFGIMPAELTTTDFAALGLPNRAFLGWKKKIFTAGFDSSRHTFVLRFFENWLEGGQDLNDALATAATATIGNRELNKLQIRGDQRLSAQ
jgi:hypothetical protein